MEFKGGSEDNCLIKSMQNIAIYHKKEDSHLT